MNAKKLALIFLTLLSLSFAPSAAAAPVFFTWGGEKIVKEIDLPDTSDYQDKEGKHFDIGYRYKQITIFFIPVWNYDKQWCGAIKGDSDHYLIWSQDDAVAVADSAGLKLPDSPSLPFWDAYGGKILIVVLGIGYMLFGEKEKKEDATPTASLPPAQTAGLAGPMAPPRLTGPLQPPALAGPTAPARLAGPLQPPALTGPTAPPLLAGSALPPPLDAPPDPSLAQWHYIDSSGQQQGPVTAESLHAGLHSGQLQPETFVWHEGLPQWETLQTALPALSAQATTPMPPAATVEPTAATPPPIPAEPLPEPFAAPAVAIQRWHYMDAAGQQHGPVSDDFLRASLQCGEVRPETFVWRDGLAQWQPLQSVVAQIGFDDGGQPAA